MSDPGGAPVSNVAWTLEGGPRELDEDDARRALVAALSHGGEATLVVDLVFVDKATLAGLHADYLDDPSETDVITFDLRGEGSADEPGPAGEIYVSVDRARAIAAERGVSVARELTLYVVHGALHLVGFDDHEADERRAMRSAEAAVMEVLGHAPDDAPHEI